MYNCILVFDLMWQGYTLMKGFMIVRKSKRLQWFGRKWKTLATIGADVIGRNLAVVPECRSQNEFYSAFLMPFGTSGTTGNIRNNWGITLANQEICFHSDPIRDLGRTIIFLFCEHYAQLGIEFYIIVFRAFKQYLSISLSEFSMIVERDGFSSVIARIFFSTMAALMGDTFFQILYECL